jgi:hypothetical protein
MVTFDFSLLQCYDELSFDMRFRDFMIGLFKEAICPALTVHLDIVPFMF